MKGIIRNLFVTSMVVAAIVGLSGCTSTARTIDSSSDLTLSAAGTDAAVVFGKFRLIRNGEEAHISTSLLGTSATIKLVNLGAGEELAGQVGANGEFAWALEPGFYRVASIRFDNRGDNVEPITNFTFAVDGNHGAVYIGTVTLEATFDSGYYGLNGVVEGYSVNNDCASGCADRLQRIGMDPSDLTISLMHEQSPLASTN